MNLTGQMAREGQDVRLPSRREDNKLRLEDRAAHDWYRFVLSYPAHLVRTYVERFELVARAAVLDPFCGTGTTVVECQKAGLAGFGIEPNPMAVFASRTKVDWAVDPDELLRHARHIATLALNQLAREGIEDETPMPLLGTGNAPHPALRTLRPDALKLLLTDSLSPLPMHKAIVLLDVLDKNQVPRLLAHEHLALAKSLVHESSNLHFGPEIGVGAKKPDAAVIGPWLRAVKQIAADLRTLRPPEATKTAFVHQADARELASLLKPASIDAVITSPPYPNEKDYTRTTRLESVMLGFIKSKDDLRRLKQNLVRSNTRSVYKSDTDDRLVADHAEIQRIADAIESRRLELGKTSGFERLYARVTRLYFGGMLRHLLDLRAVLRPGARLAYVVGDQASYLRVMIRTGQLLADLAKSAGYEVLGIDLFRTRLATATREQLREEVVVLRWPGPPTINGWSTREVAAPQLNENYSGEKMKTAPMAVSAGKPNRYSAIIEKLFFAKHEAGKRELPFEREDLERFAAQLKIKLPKNLGDLIYSFRYRNPLPARIVALAPPGEAWVIRPSGRGRYCFALMQDAPILPNERLAITKVPDATPGIVTKYALSDEQALLAKVRYNRLVDIFSGVTCYSLQNHLRTTVPGMGQVETDEIYIGIDKKGAHYVFPVQAKGGKDKLNVVQIEQDFAVGTEKFPLLVCRPIAAQFMPDGVIALFEFESGAAGIKIVCEKHYQLVSPKEVTDDDLRAYRGRLETTG